MKTYPLLILMSVCLSACDREEPAPLRADHPYRQPANPGRPPDKDQKVPQGAQATGDIQTRTGDGVVGGEKPTSGDHVGAGSNAGGSPSGAPTAGGTGRPEEKK